jgi:hypothetical protein
MKTLAQSLTVSAAMYTLLFLLIASFAFGSEMNTNPVTDSVTEQTEFAFVEEGYVNDIPFDTESIAMQHHFEVSMETAWDFEDEAYIDDIPFDTREVALKSKVHYASIK